MHRSRFHALVPVLLIPAAVWASEFRSTWNQAPDRVWLGADTWANPMEDWRLHDGRAECISDQPNRNLFLLTRHLDPSHGEFTLSIRLDRVTDGTAGAAGFRIGIKDAVEDYRAAALRGKGLDCGVTAGGTLYIGRVRRGQVATRHGLDRAGWIVHRVSSTQGGSEGPESALDGDPATFWHSKHVTEPYPHEFVLDLGEPTPTTGLGYLPRQGSNSGHLKEVEIYLSGDGVSWGKPVTTGRFVSGEQLQNLAWDPIDSRYVRLVMRSGHLDRPAGSVAELYVYGPDAGPHSAPAPVSAPPVPNGPWRLVLQGRPANGHHLLNLRLEHAESGQPLAELEGIRIPFGQTAGGLGLFHAGGAGRFAFSDWRVSGTGVKDSPERAWGPILWAMHSLSNSRGPEGHVLKLTAQMPPLGDHDPRTVTLQMGQGDTWRMVATADIDADACTARFRLPNWPADRDVPYRLCYTLLDRSGTGTETRYTGTVRRDPNGQRPLVVAGFTGHTDYVFPNIEIARNVDIHDPDVLFFSGDQLYEHVGGYGIIRKPADRSILNYLRKWYLLGWAFGDLMRDRVTLCLPDDHDVYQGNIWGEAGIDPGGMAGHAAGGYAQPVEMVNAVHRTQTSHHPDPFDPTPIARGISVYYGDMVFGRISFAVLADRMFKSGPQGKVNTWTGRPDHVKSPEIDVASLDAPGLALLGHRQEAFLESWASDWRGADQKIALSQTIFCNVANYHGPGKEFIIADLDANGWPQAGRNRALALLRKGSAFHLAGDQHLASIVHHGIDAHRDAGWSFCVPSIAAGYPRSWLPDLEGRPVRNRPPPRLANTGDYADGLGNRVTVHAVGNPSAKNRTDTPATLAHDKASGYGIVRMDPAQQTITMECWRLQFDAGAPRPDDQFPGWPRTIHQFDNDGRQPYATLPELAFAPGNHPVVQVVDEADGDVQYTVRVKSATYRPRVFQPGTYTVRHGDPDQGPMTVQTGIHVP